ncbi:S66 peptidase family protein [Desulfospira joergensenii]|uniref:S66 peptidase family protein n=1 Tax=Desulfospira joergensenii TaxID=53329 RepID=UPI0003B5981C|nr:LD-carboxypeptidase [Desulfospira joergensenii]
MPEFRPVKPGDTIGVAAPSARFESGRFEKGVARLENLGFKVHVPEGVFEKKRYLAGEDPLRARILNDLFKAPDIKGIIAARGGFGSMRMLEYLDWKSIQAHPKPVIGFSDVTALLNSLIQRAGLAGIHGPNLVSLADASSQTLSSFVRALSNQPLDIELEQGICLAPGRAGGILKGGNLATLVHMIGTPYPPDFSGAVLFLEDTGEPAYKIDRMLSQMRLAGLFKGIRALVAGSFADCRNSEYIPEIFSEIFEPCNIPVLMGLKSGHGPCNLSLVMGRKVEVDASARTIRWE